MSHGLERFTVIAACSALFMLGMPGSTTGQPPPQDVPGVAGARVATTEHKEYSTAGEHVWEKPAHVKYALVFGCAGGGGGGGGVALPQRAGGGGGGARPRWTVVGPLTEQFYTVRIGKGGVGGSSSSGSVGNFAGGSGKDGTATEFVGVNRTEAFVPGLGGSPARKTSSSAADPPIAPAQSTGVGPFGGAGGSESVTGQNGGNGDFANGGQGVRGGGGGAGLGHGGAGGAFTVGGSNGSNGSVCAGGGGSGIKPGAPSAAKAGKGGDGYMKIVPLVDMDRVQTSIEQMLKRVDEVLATPR